MKGAVVQLSGTPADIALKRDEKNRVDASIDDDVADDVRVEEDGIDIALHRKATP